MVFSSLLFLFLFLPLVLLGYYIVPKSMRNILLLGASIFFYTWGEAQYALLMVFSIFLNWIFGNILGAYRCGKFGKHILLLAVFLNLLPLIIFKYSHFFLLNLSSLSFLNHIITSSQVKPLHLPIGISFFTFQAISYLIDIYRDTSKPQKNLVNIGLYISFFPQLIAGPIVRYKDIAKEITKRKVTTPLFFEGVSRFVYGLSKKVLLANPLGAMSDIIFSLPSDQLSSSVAWLGLMTYSLQIYFDFSGYSDMAIGLGKMFGFNFLENFNYPFISKSVREFWRRWHISLSNWFKDYLYIPLGGSKRSNFRTYLNLLSIFILCGLWHGASWNYLLWGLSHGTFMLLERYFAGKVYFRVPRVFQHLYFIFFLLNTWVLFRIESLKDIKLYYLTLYGFKSSELYLTPIMQKLDSDFFIPFFLGIIIATPVFSKFGKKILNRCLQSSQSASLQVLLTTGHVALLSFLLFCSWLQLASGAYNPFIYFRF